MFDSCMDEDKIETLGAQPLLDLIKDYGSWNITDGNWTDEKWTFVETFVKIHKYLSIAPLFNMYVSADLKDSTKNVIVVSFLNLLLTGHKGTSATMVLGPYHEISALISIMRMERSEVHIYKNK